MEIAQDTDNKNPPRNNHEIAKNAAIVYSTEAEVQLCPCGNNFNPEREEIGAPMLQCVQILHWPIVLLLLVTKRPS